MITIRGINGDILTHFDNNVPEGNPYFEPVMTDDMESLVSSFSFSVPLELADTEHLVGLNQVLVKDRQEDLRLFIITDVHEVWTTVGGTLQVTCEDISINEMNNIIVSPFESLNFQDTLTKTFKNSGWALKYGANWKDVDNTTFKVENYDNMRSVIASIVDTYGCQFKFMAQENQFGEITRVAEVYKSRGNNTGKYFYYDRDLLGIERDINHADIKTAIHPYYTGYNGKTYSLKGFAPANPDPDFKKDKESPLIINREASKLFDDGNSYRIMPYKTEVEGNPELVYREAIKELKKYAEPVYTYSVNVLLLQNMIGWEGEDIDLGDTVWMKERVGNRELGLEARVTAYEYHEDDPSKDVVTFSNFKEIDTTDVPELAERIFVAYANSEDGTIDFSISDSVGKAYMGVYTAAVSTQSTDPSTYSWTRIKGEDGISAPTLNLTSSQQVMKFKPDGTPDGDQTIIFTALKQNSTETVTWEAIPYKGDIAQPSITLGGTGDVRSLTSAVWNNGWTRVKVTVSMGSLKDIQTIVMVSDGATGASGKAIVGYVTNESTTFAAASDGTVTDYGNGNGKFVLYEGTSEVTSGITFARVSQVGINLLINDTTGEYKVSNMTADMAQASVSATYKGITLTKFLSFSKSKQGAKGDKGDTGNDGIAGKDGIGLKSTTVTYAASTSGTTAPSKGWQEQVPAVAPDNFLWTRTVWTYTDDTSETGYSVAKMGKDGAKGNDGIAGKDGVGIKTTLVEYVVSTSGTTRPASGWSTTIPNTPQGQYLWTRTTWTYTDKTTEQGYSVARMGQDGARGNDGIAGKDGVGLKSTAISYAGSANGTTPPTTGWNTQVPTIPAGQYLWTKTVWNYTDNSNETGYSVARMGQNGNDGKDGIAGKDGVGIKDTTIEYSVSTSGTTRPTSGWSTSIPTVPQGQYLWTRTTWAYTDNTTEQGFTVARQGEKGDKGDQGIVGPKGADGRTQYTHIAYADNASGGGFSQNPTGKAYIGMYVDFEELDSSDPKKYAWSLIKGADGERGVAGPKGEDGRTPYFHTAYANSEDGSLDFSTTDSTDRKYMGTYTDYEQNDSTDPKRYTWSLIKGADGISSFLHTAWANVNEFPFYVKGARPNLAVKWENSSLNSNNGASYPQNSWFENDPEDGHTIIAAQRYNPELNPHIINMYNSLGITYNSSDPHASWLTEPIAGKRVIVSYKAKVNRPSVKFNLMSTVTRTGEGNKNLPNNGKTVTLTNEWQVISDVIDVVPNNAEVLRMCPQQSSGVDYVMDLVVYVKDYKIEFADNENDSQATPWLPPIIRPLFDGKELDASKGQTVGFDKYGDSTPKNEFNIKVTEWGATNAVRTTVEANNGTGLMVGQMTLADAPKTNGTDYYDGYIYVKNDSPQPVRLKPWGGVLNPIIPPNTIARIGSAAFRTASDGYIKWELHRIDATLAVDVTWWKPRIRRYSIDHGFTESQPSAERMYLGTYTDDNPKASGDPADYEWNLVKGSDGNDGAPAKALTLQADSPVMKFDANDVVVAGQVITFTAVKQNFDSSIAWVATPYKGNTAQPAIALKGTGDVRTLEASMWASGVTTVRVDVSADSFRDSVTITKVKDGAKGDRGSDGIAGKDGVGIRTTSITYAGSASGTTPPTTGWQTQVPTVPAGQFLWTKTVWTYTDNSTETGYSAAMMGKDGAKGNDGIAGKDGVGIKTTVIEYAVNTSGTTKPTTGWTTAVPNTPQGQFLWTRTTWTYTDNTTEQGFTVARQGANGANGNDGVAGKDGVGLKSTSITYAGSTSGTTPPTTGWNTQVPTVPAGQFLWTKTVWTYTDSSSETGYSVAKMGQDGAKGNDGIAGKDGVGIKTTLIEYAANASGTVRPTSGWSTTIPNTPAGQYLWTRTTWTYTDNTTEQGYTVARQGANGTNGTNGTNGIDAYSAILSNEANTFAANPAGAVTDWSTGKGTFMVYRGTTRLTSGVAYAVASSVDATGTINATTGDYTVTALAKDNGSITFKATIGSTVLTKTMSLSKARQGVQGVQGTMGIAFYSPTEPTGDNVKEGSTWFKTVSTADDTIAGIYTYKGGKWVKTEVASGALSVEKLSALSADLGDVTAGNIAGVNITGASFINPFDFTDVSMNHLKGTTEIADSEIGIEGVVNEGATGARKFVNSITPSYFQSIHKDANDTVLRSVNTSSSGIILNDSNVTTSFNKDGLRVVDMPRNASSWNMSTRIGLSRGSDGSTMEILPDGPVLNNRKNIQVWQGTGDTVRAVPNLGRVSFGTYQSIGWGMVNEDIPIRVHNSYIWQAKRSIKLEVIAQVNVQDALSPWVYITAQTAMTTATDKSPRQTINIGKIGQTNYTDAKNRIPWQNTVLCTGYFMLNEGEYFSIVGNCDTKYNCGNMQGMSISFREIFST